MLPIGDTNSCGRGKATVTWSLIAINIAVFVLFQGFGTNVRATLALAAYPGEILAGRRLLSLLTSQFAHAGLGHLAGNMLFLGIFGDNVECRIGRARYTALYLLSGLAGALAHLAAALFAGGAALQTPLVGASAAISGVLAAYLVLFPGNKVMVLLFNFIPTALSAWLVIGFWFFFQVIRSLGGGFSAGGTAYLAHVGGFAASWFWSRSYKRREESRLAEERRRRLASGESGGVRWWVVSDDDEA